MTPLSPRARPVISWVVACAISAFVGYLVDIALVVTLPSQQVIVTTEVIDSTGAVVQADPLPRPQPAPHALTSDEILDQARLRASSWLEQFAWVTVLGGLAQLALIAIVRWTNAPRPYFEAPLAGFVIPFYAALAWFGMSGLGLATTLFLFAPNIVMGVVAGLSYWLIAGRPHPPYTSSAAG